tara:strand:+ start:211 stop:636 length:426 start_codon:yes stop_codon:yes gene_type:complete
MGRHGYNEGDGNNWQYIKWAGMTASAARGKRGQAMLRELLAALDAMPDKKLITRSVVDEDGCCCTVGALLKEKEVPYLDKLVAAWEDEDILAEWNDDIAEDLDVSPVLLQEIEYANDEMGFGESPSDRWFRMRAWVAGKLV